MSKQPLVSVLIPMKNARAFVGDALESIRTQDYPRLQIIVVDDESTDGSGEVVRSFGDPRVVLVANEGRGIACGFNTGLKHARGEYVMRCDADDWFMPGRVRRQVDFLENHPEVHVACGLQLICWHDGTPLIPERGADNKPRFISEDINSDRWMPRTVTAIYRVSCLRAIGGCRAYFVTCEDDDLMMRLAERFAVWVVPDIVYRTRIRKGSITRSTSVSELKWYVARAREFQQQRLQTGTDALGEGHPPVPPVAFESTSVRSPAMFAQHLLMGESWWLLDAESASMAIRAAMRAIGYCPCRLAGWVHLMRLIVVAGCRRLVPRARGSQVAGGPGA